MSNTLRINISYSQLAIYRADLDLPFNDWSDGHVAQGFAWRDGSVSFRTVAEAGPHLVEVSVVQHLPPVHFDTLRALEVPFSVRGGTGVEVASIGDAVAVDIADGDYALRCEFLPEVEDAPRARLVFASRDPVRFCIVKNDPELVPPEKLITDAQPAG